MQHFTSGQFCTLCLQVNILILNYSIIKVAGIPYLSILVELMMVSIKANLSCFSDQFLVSDHFENILLFLWPGVITFGFLYFLRVLSTRTFLLYFIEHLK